MSAIGLIASVGVGAGILWAFYMGLRGALAEAPPFMQGVGGTKRYDTRLRKVA